MSQINYIYIFVRKDISLEQQLVQAAHVACVAGEKFNDSDSHMVLLSVSDIDELMYVSHQLDFCEIQHAIFFEPDNNMGNSAIATAPINGAVRCKIQKIISKMGVKLWTN